jgi:hypothetical protein
MTTLDQIIAAQQRQVKQVALSGEQRHELRALRKEVLELRGSARSVDHDAQADRVQGALARAGADADAGSKVVAIKPSPALRDRLLEAQKRLGADAYKHIVLTALELGIEELERGAPALDNVQELVPITPSLEIAG